MIYYQNEAKLYLNLRPLKHANVWLLYYALVKFTDYSKKRPTASDYKHVCCCTIEVNINGTPIGQGLRSSIDKSMSQFAVQDNDICEINKKNVLKRLPTPALLVKKKKTGTVISRPNWGDRA